LQPNLFFSVLLALGLGFALGALTLFLIALISRTTRKPAVLRWVPTLVALGICVALFRLTSSFRTFLERLAYQHDLDKLVVLGLLAAALAMGLRLSVLILRGDRSRD
jgi:RsiW-degrading membrane proteinase PrsW (M82 family)